MLLLSFILIPSLGIAKTSFEEKEPVYWSVQVENDLFGSGSDRFYTNGIQFNYVKRHTPPKWLDNIADRLPLFISTDAKAGGYSFGQKIFTPEDTQEAALITTDRPYAGWLYTTASIASLIKDTPKYREINALEFTVGIVGPSSLAGTVQNEYHQLIGVETAKGWDNQLKDELGLNVTYVRKHENFRTLKNGLEYAWSPHRVLSLGNVYTYAGGGMMLRLGNNLKNDIGPPNINPGFPGSAFFSPEKGGRSWYVFAGIEGRVIAQNIFLDGNSFEDSHSVDKKNLVADLQYGISYQRNNMRVTFSNLLRTKEFYGQKDNAKFGAVNISFLID